MAKDYGQGVLPIGEDYMDFSERPAWALIKWNEIIDVLQSLLNDIGEQHSPVWTVGASHGWDTVIMFIPSKSVMGRRWAADMRGILRGLGNMGNVLRGSNGTVAAVG